LYSFPTVGPLFPKIFATTDNARSAEFYRRCKLFGIKGVSLHSYRYAWAERAKTCGYPERFAQAALGHNSKAVHRAYAKKAHVVIPTLEDYERTGSRDGGLRIGSDYLPKDLLEAHGGKMVTLVDNDGAIIGERVINDLLAIQTLNDSNVNDSTGAPPTTNLANRFDRQIQKCREPFAPLIEQLS
jgi:hypothetical protein